MNEIPDIANEKTPETTNSRVVLSRAQTLEFLNDALVDEESKPAGKIQIYEIL